MNKRKRVARLKQRQNKKRFEALQRGSVLDDPVTQTRRTISVASRIKEASLQDPLVKKSPKRTRNTQKVELEAPLNLVPESEEIKLSSPSTVTNESPDKSSASKSKKVEQARSSEKEKPKRNRTTSTGSTEEEKPKRAKRTVKKIEDA
tara:strand:- start:7670 stop:8113 length:444 start_codon:yes stop_codon:yes gene_type:complete